MNAFVIAGGVLAAWAVIVALLGMRGFPRSRGGERAAIGITVVLFLGAVGSAIADQTKVGERHGPHAEEHAEPEKAPPASEPSQAAAPEGGQSDDEGEQDASGEQSNVALEADPSGALKFNQDSAKIPAGRVTLTMKNPSSVPHDISLRGNGIDEHGEVVQKDGESKVTANVQPGLSYQYYCSVPGHEQGGMKGTLQVSE
jgi:plastocyanin